MSDFYDLIGEGLKPEVHSPGRKVPGYAHLGYTERMLLALPGINPWLAALLPEERSSLRTLAYQFIAIWLLLWTVQAIAFTTLSGSVPIGMAAAALSATLIILADRAFMIADAFCDGEFWYHHDLNPNHEGLWKLRSKRYAAMAARYLIGITISITVVTIATPALLKFEITSLLNIERIGANQGIEDEIRDFNAKKRQIWDGKRQELLDAGAPLASVEARLRELRQSQHVTAPAENPLIPQLEAQILELKAQADFADRCANAEERGVALAMCDSQIPATGLPGCRARCIAWKTEALNLRESAVRVNTDLAHIRMSAQTQISQEQDALATLIATQEKEIARLQILVKAAEDATAAAEKEWHSSTEEFAARLRSSPQYDAVDVAGLVRIYDSADAVMAKASPSTLKMLLYLKALLVCLETICFTTRLFGMARSYSKSVYLLYVKRWNLSPCRPSQQASAEPNPAVPSQTSSFRQRPAGTSPTDVAMGETS